MRANALAPIIVLLCLGCVKVRYADHWFWIDHGDFSSKRVFAFAQLLFALTEKQEAMAQPVVTIQAGGS